MSLSSGYNAVMHAGRTARLLFTLAVAPALVLCSFPAPALLIHGHDGHETHGHTLTVHGLDDWRENPGHRHEGHEHDGLTADLPEHDDDPIVIVFDLPDALLRVRGLSSGTITFTGFASTPRAVSATVDQDTGGPSLIVRPRTRAPDTRAGSTIACILLSNHALLL